jgi:hypothetical protein
LIDHSASTSFLSQPVSAGPKLDALRSSTASFLSVGDREMSRQMEELLATPTGRRRIWDFSTHLHCSIIGTCLSTGELRHLLGKLGLKEATTASEHDVHASGVLIASRRHGGAKLLHKALDRRHQLLINQFDKAKTTEEVRASWKEAMQRGEIPRCVLGGADAPSD